MMDAAHLLKSHWNRDALTVQPVGPVWRVATAEGDYCLKAGKHGIPHLLFDHHAIEGLWARGFDGTPRLVPTSSGAPFAETPEGPVALMRWVGRPLDTTSQMEWQGAAAQLARFHLASVGLKLPSSLKKFYFSGKWSHRFVERCAELEQALAAFSAPANDLEAAMFEAGDRVLGLAHAVDALLQQSAYAQLVEELESTPILSHGNMKAQNFTVAEDGTISIIDFDSFRVDVPVQDVAHLLADHFLRCDWSLTGAQGLFEAYHAQRPLAKGEADALIALLSFPYEPWKVIHKYREEGRSVTKSWRKWKRAVEQMERNDEFLKKWASWLTNRVQ
jgi:CotS family spore coat protein